jgi:hypothetical protein
MVCLDAESCGIPIELDCALNLIGDTTCSDVSDGVPLRLGTDEQAHSRCLLDLIRDQCKTSWIQIGGGDAEAWRITQFGSTQPKQVVDRRRNCFAAGLVVRRENREAIRHDDVLPLMDM